MTSLTRMHVQLSQTGASTEDLEELTYKFRGRLLEFDEVVAVDLAREHSMPESAKSGEAAVVGMLLVTLAQSPDVLAALTTGVIAWINGQKGRSAKLTIEGDSLDITGISSADQRRLIDHFLKRHC